MKIVVNKCYGGFSLSKTAAQRLVDLNGYKGAVSCYPSCPRNSRYLVRVVEEMGEAANGGYARLAVVDIPDNATDWEIDEYDGMESVIYVVDGKIHHA